MTAPINLDQIRILVDRIPAKIRATLYRWATAVSGTLGILIATGIVPDVDSVQRAAGVVAAIVAVLGNGLAVAYTATSKRLTRFAKRAAK